MEDTTDVTQTLEPPAIEEFLPPELRSMYDPTRQFDPAAMGRQFKSRKQEIPFELDIIRENTWFRYRRLCELGHDFEKRKPNTQITLKDMGGKNFSPNQVRAIFLSNRMYLNYVLIPPKETVAVARAAMSRGLEELAHLVTGGLVQDKGGKYNINEARFLLQALKYLDFMVNGPAVQKHLNLHAEVDAKKLDGPRSVEEIERKIEELKRKQSGQLPKPPEEEIVLDRGPIT